MARNQTYLYAGNPNVNVVGNTTISV